MSKVKGDYWKVNEKTVKLQIKQARNRKLEEALPDGIVFRMGTSQRQKKTYMYLKRFSIQKSIGQTF